MKRGTLVVVMMLACLILSGCYTQGRFTGKFGGNTFNVVTVKGSLNVLGSGEMSGLFTGGELTIGGVVFAIEVPTTGRIVLIQTSVRKVEIQYEDVEQPYVELLLETRPTNGDGGRMWELSDSEAIDRMTRTYIFHVQEGSDLDFIMMMNS